MSLPAILKGRAKLCQAALLGLFALLCTAPALAHEPTIAVLALRDQGKGHYLGNWSLPPVDVTLKPIFPAQCKWTPPQLDCGARGLVGRLSFEGLGSKQSATMIRVVSQQGEVQAYTVSAGNPYVTVATEPGANIAVWLELANTYINLGIDHILLGIDHLLFVLGLIWLVRGRWMLVKTITAFTVAHSITLAGAALGYFSLPQPPVEATIALSIAFVASELVKMKPGERRLSEAYPWVVAFSFGLLHGFGFAGALREIGLPQRDVPLALLTFNLGVEAGQLMFVGAVLLIYEALKTVTALPVSRARVAAAYLIGIVAAVWFIDRVAGFVVT